MLLNKRGDDLGVELVSLLDGALVAGAASDKGAECKDGCGAHLGNRITGELNEMLIGVVAHALPSRLRIVLPAKAEADAAPLTEQSVLVVARCLVINQQIAVDY